ncbi:MAG: hypothetical protein OYM47_07815 [Gemmatimonadota bacterium]|nr:hypothetical protein [Gemmatimonadota bacterium]
MAEFDAISKHLIQTYPDDFVGFTLGREDVEVLEVLDTQQPTVSANHADSLIRVRIDGREALVHNEFQTGDSTDPPMPRRMAGYIGRAIERHGLPVCSSVIYLRPDAGGRDPGQYWQSHPGHQVLVRYRVIRLSEVDGQRVLDAGHEGLIPFAPLMKRPEGMASRAWLLHCLRTAHARPIAPPAKADFMAGMSLLSGLVYAPEAISDIISKEGMMDLLRESSFAQYLTRQGIEQGIEQGLRESILAVLEVRFDLPPSHPYAERIANVDDTQGLKALHRAAVQVSGLDAFGQLLDEESG